MKEKLKEMDFSDFENMKNIYRIDSLGGCMGVYCYGNQTHLFESIKDAEKAIDWLKSGEKSFLPNMYSIVDVDTNEVVKIIK